MNVRYLLVSVAIILGIVALMMWGLEGHVDISELLRTSAIAFAVLMVFQFARRKGARS